LRLIKGFEVTDTYENEDAQRINELAADWLEHKFQQMLVTLEDHYRTYRLSDAIMLLYSFIWDDFCSWYLEMIKPGYEQPIDRPTYERTLVIFEKLMTVLHPFMPFVSEEIWHGLKERTAGDDCVISAYPIAQEADAAMVARVEQAKEIVSKIREARNNNGVKNKEELALYVQKTEGADALLAVAGIKEMIQKMGNLSSLAATEAEIPQTVAFIAGTDQFYLELNQEIDVEAEREKLEKELEYAKGFIQSVGKKLSNERFVNNAPAAVVDKERQKMADGEARIKALEESLAKLG
ncbi:MAG: class I tRNA ligase family protein, partial [Bacteroidota bacterium]